MDVSLTSKPHALSLAPCTYLPDHCLFPSRLRLVRTQYLGDARHLRPPGGLRARKKSLKLLQHRSSPLIVRASGNSNAVFVVVIAVVAVSVISLFFFDRMYPRKKSRKRVTNEKIHPAEKQEEKHALEEEEEEAQYMESNLAREKIYHTEGMCQKTEGLSEEKQEERYTLEEEEQALESLESTLACERMYPAKEMSQKTEGLPEEKQEERYALEEEQALESVESTLACERMYPAEEMFQKNEGLPEDEQEERYAFEEEEQALETPESTLSHENIYPAEEMFQKTGGLPEEKQEEKYAFEEQTQALESLESTLAHETMDPTAEMCQNTEDLPEEKQEERHAVEEKEQAFQSLESASACDETSASSVKSPASQIFASGEDELILSSENKFENNHLAVDAESEQQSLVLDGEVIELQSQEDKVHEDCDAELPKLVVKSQGAAPDHNVHVPGGQNNQVESKEQETTSYHGVLVESGRAELHTFYPSKQLKMVKGNDLNLPQRPATFQGTGFNGSGFSSLPRHRICEQEKLSSQDFFNNGNAKFTLPFVCYEGASSGKRQVIQDGRELSGAKGRKHLSSNSSPKLPLLPHRNEFFVDKRHHPAKQLSTYSCLLKEGRVNDCVDFLEDMEKLGMLDMDKVYHARFYETCKGLKAVDEAFRFTKLISNPTLSTFNMLMSVCANSLDSEGAFQVLQLVEEVGLKADCKLYTTLISTCAKCGKVDRMFEVFHKMVNAGVEPNVHTYGALIDGCARAGQVAKAFGAYGILRSKKVNPDRVVFNALITACGQSGAVDRAFDVLAEMRSETKPIDPDHITVGALIKACSNAGQVDRAKEVYKMMSEFKIKGTPEVYTIAINCCSQTGDWDFALGVYNDMIRNGVIPDEIFLSALIDVAGHAGRIGAAFDVIEEARNRGMHLGIVSYSSLMGACSNAKCWEKALELYEDMKSMGIELTISTMNALITALCEGDQLPKAMEILYDLKKLGLCTNTITYSILLVASEKKDDIESGIALFSQAKKDGVSLNITMCRCMIGMCLRKYLKARTLGENVLSLNSAWPQAHSRWTSMALTVYRESISAGVTPTMEVVSQVLGCLQFPFDVSLKSRIIENLGVSVDTSRYSNLCSLVEGFAEYDPRAFSILEEAASLGVVPFVSFKENPLVVDVRMLQIHTAEVYILTVLKGLKHRLAAGVKLPNLTILLPIEKTQVASSHGEKSVNVAGRLSQAVAALLRRLGLPYQGNESYGKIRVNGLALRRWFQPKLASPFSGKPGEFGLSHLRLGSGITRQQRNIRTGNLSLE